MDKPTRPASDASAKRILVVEDEKAIRDMIGFGLRRAGYEVIEAGDHTESRQALGDAIPDLILLDWMLPGMSGLQLLRELRNNAITRELPVILLTARAEEPDMIRGLDCGADDYVTKPFSTLELLARIRALLRRTSDPDGEEVIRYERLELDRLAHRISVGDEAIALGPTEYRLLSFLMAHPERVYSRAQLLDRVWGTNVYVEERTVDVHVRRIRAALGAYGYDRFIQTVRGAGYRFSRQQA